MDPEFAAQRFYENLVHFGNAKTNPEKFNLYMGLQHLAIMVETLLSKVSNLEGEIQRLKR